MLKQFDLLDGFGQELMNLLCTWRRLRDASVGAHVPTHVSEPALVNVQMATWSLWWRGGLMAATVAAAAEMMVKMVWVVNFPGAL